MNHSTICIYGLTPDNIVRLDMITVNSNGLVSEDDIIQFGNSKDDSSLPQIKIVLSVLDCTEFIKDRPLHVVIAYADHLNFIFVVTAYEPDNQKWDSEFRRRQ